MKQSATQNAAFVQRCDVSAEGIRHFRISQSSALSISSIASAEEPDERYQHAEYSIDRRENPRLGFIKKNLVQPVFDKRLAIA
jgi:hypothetical protein